MDYHFTPDTAAGFALAGGGTNWGLANNLGGGRSDAVQAGIYGITRAGPAYLGGALAFANHWFTTNRVALGDQLTASFVGQSYGARVEGGYRYAPLPMLGVTPYAAIQAQDFSTPRYSENDLSGGGLGLTFASMNATDVRSELGARLDSPTAIGRMPLVLRARLAWAHDFVNNPALAAAFQVLPGSNFIVNGAPIPHELGAYLRRRRTFPCSELDAACQIRRRIRPRRADLRRQWDSALHVVVVTAGERAQARLPNSKYGTNPNSNSRTSRFVRSRRSVLCATLSETDSE